MKKILLTIILGIYLISLVSAVSCNDISLEPEYTGNKTYTGLEYIRIKDTTEIDRGEKYWKGYGSAKITLPSEILLKEEEKIELNPNIPAYDYQINATAPGEYKISVKFSWFCNKKLTLNLLDEENSKKQFIYDPSFKEFSGISTNSNSLDYQEEKIEPHGKKIVELNNNPNRNTNRDPNSNRGPGNNNKGGSSNKASPSSTINLDLPSPPSTPGKSNTKDKKEDSSIKLSSSVIKSSEDNTKTTKQTNKNFIISIIEFFRNLFRS